MYFFIGFLLLIALFLGFCALHRYRAIQKICCMSCCDKQNLLDTILKPFGYCYVHDQDLISTRNDAWQRLAGYTAFFDKAALPFHMVFDALPVYFDYHGRTWLIELWKGQYGICTGAEVGVYHANRLLTPEEYSTAHFQVVSDAERLPIAFTLFQGEKLLAAMSHTAWWLTAFLPGVFTKLSELSMETVISLPSQEMLHRFMDALNAIGQENETLRFSCCCHGTQVRIRYSCGCPSSPSCPERISCLRRLQIRWVQLCNRFSCFLYRRITRPFDSTLDQILFLYELLPFILRHTLRRLKGVLRT